MANYNLNDQRIKDLAEQAAKGFTPLPAGKYLMRCKTVTHKIVNEKEAWDLDWQVVAGEPHEHESCRDTLFFSEKAIGRVLLCCNALGLKDAELSNIDPRSEKSRNLLVGRTAIVDVEHKVDQKGRTWANPKYAGYSVAHPGSVEDLKKERSGAAAGGATGVKPSGDPASLGPIPFSWLFALPLIGALL